MADHRLFVVLGMHRSGTSAITRGLEALNVNLGEQLMPPVANNNDKGFFEDLEVNKLNIDLLDAIDSGWDAFSVIPAGTLNQERLEQYKLRAIKLICSKVGERPFGLKDPRISRLLPFWQSVFDRAGVTVSYVIAVRNPLSIVQSLMKRDGFDPEKSYFLWLGHVLPAILQTHGSPRVAVNFDLLISDPYAQLSRIARSLDLPFDPHSAGVQEYASEFLDAKLRHAEFDMEDVRTDCAAPGDVTRAYEMLVRLACDEVEVDAPEVEELFKQLNANLDAFSPAFSYMTRSDKRMTEGVTQIVSLNGQMACLNGQIASLNGQIASLIAERQNLLNSTSWRITKPLRALYPIAPAFFRRFSALALQVRERAVLLQNPPAHCRPYEVRVMGSYSADRPRVVHALANFYLGGSSRLVVDLLEHLSHQYEQEVITKVQPDPPSYTGVPVHEFRFDESTQVAQRVFRFLCEFKPSICHIHYWGESDRPWYEAVMKAAEQFGCQVIENINTPVAPYWGEAIARYVYVSDYVLETFGQRNEKSLTIYPGSDLSLFVRNDMRDVPDDCIGMVYRLEDDKLTEQSIDVFIKVAKRRPSTRVLMVGGGRFLKSYKKAVRSHGVMKAFQFTGYVAYEDLPELYQGMSIFVAPVWKESFGHVSVLAMNCGIPVVGYNVGALAEIIGGRDLLAPPGDSDRLADIVVELLQDREKRLSIGRANQKRAQALFSVQAMVTSYGELYESVLGQGR
jgi:glycosyltransferase involved in cell wall biosynthesis